MEERDYFKKQIDVLGRILGKLISELINLKNEEDIVSAIEVTNKKLSDNFNLSLQEIAFHPEELFINFLVAEKNFSNENLEQLAEIIIFNNKVESSTIEKKHLNQKVLILLEYVAKNDNTFSIQRNLKIEKIKSEISCN